LKTRAQTYTATLLKRKWLSKKAFEIFVSRPPGFAFKPGQRISLSLEGHERDYSLISAPKESVLKLCIRDVAGGMLSTLLSNADIDTPLLVSGPHGYFTYKPSSRSALFVATGTGIAPFCSMARSGISGFKLLHGVSLPQDLYYASLFRQSAKNYIPCLSEAKKLPANAFQGKVTQYLEQHLAPQVYDFYLCGRREMIRDVTLLIDERFPGSLVYTELFY
jgi:benzoate/toluate 1,2-dioxygenase reductase subunit